MARAKTKSSAKDRICSDPFIVDDDDGHSAVASEDDYEAVSNDDGESLGDVSEDSLDEEEHDSDLDFIETPTKTRSKGRSRHATPPPATPTPKRNTRGTKRPVKEAVESDSEEEVFIPSPTQDSPKKTRTNISAPSTPSRKNRAKTPSTPSPAKKKGQQLLDDTVTKQKAEFSSSSPTKPALDLGGVNKTPASKGKLATPSTSKSSAMVKPLSAKATPARTPKVTSSNKAMKTSTPTSSLKRVNASSQDQSKPKSAQKIAIKGSSKSARQSSTAGRSSIKGNESNKSIKKIVEEPEGAEEEEDQADNDGEEEDSQEWDGDEDPAGFEDKGHAEDEDEADGSDDEGIEENNTVDGDQMVVEDSDDDEKKSKGKRVRYLEDVEPTITVPRLSKCGIYNKNLVDNRLKATYKDLVYLPSGKKIQSWYTPKAGAKVEPVRFWLFSTIFDKSFYPKADPKYLLSIVTYPGDKISGFANLARVDPTLLNARPPNPSFTKPFICYRGASTPVRCLIVGFVHEDKTTEPFVTQSRKLMKSLSLVPLALEAERNFAVTCLAFGVDSYVSDIIDNVLTLTTRFEDADSASSAPSSYTPNGRVPRLAGPSKSVGTANRAMSNTISTLSARDDVPIFDARNHKLEMARSLKTISQDLPRFDGIVPKDAVVLACYTVGAYNNNAGAFRVSNNILWAAVLCSEDS